MADAENGNGNGPYTGSYKRFRELVDEAESLIGKTLDIRDDGSIETSPDAELVATGLAAIAAAVLAGSCEVAAEVNSARRKGRSS
jgi:hypothetical protein